MTGGAFRPHWSVKLHLEVFVVVVGFFLFMYLSILQKKGRLIVMSLQEALQVRSWFGFYTYPEDALHFAHGTR